MMFRSARDSLRRCAAAAVMVAVFAAPLWAAPTALDATQKRKVRDAILLLEQAWKDCLSMKLTDVFGAGAGQMEYEKITKDGMMVDPTFQDAINHLRNMLDRDNLVTDNLAGFGTVDVQDGVDNDKIIIAKRILDKMCDTNAPAVDRMDAKFQLIATMANELAHVFQKWRPATKAQRCDGERDSDTSSIKALEPLLAAMSKNDGTPHTSVGDIRTDPQYVLTLGLCLEEYGVTSQANLAALHAKLKAKLGKEAPAQADRAGYKGRRQRFGESISGGANWADWYYAGRDDVVEGGPNLDEDGREGTFVVGSDLSTVDFFPVPPGTVAVTSRMTFNSNGLLNLYTVSANASGQRLLTAWRDIDGDGIPEQLSALTVSLPGPNAPGLPEVHSIQITQGVPLELSRIGSADGLLIHDATSGAFFMAETTPDGMPAIAPVRLAQSLVLMQNGGFDRLIEHFRPSPMTNAHRFVFREEPNMFAPVSFFDVFYDLSTSPVFGPTTLAQARGQNNAPGVETLFPGATQVVLSGNPTPVPIEIVSLALGSVQPIAVGNAGADGRTPPLPVLNIPQGNDLFRISQGTGPGSLIFLPRIGQNIDCVLSDEEGGPPAPHRLQLSVEPPRLHFIARDLLGPETLFHFIEFALENKPYGGFASWNNDEGRALLLPELPEPLSVFTPIPDFFPPPYAQRVLDLNNDGLPGEAVIVARFSKNPSFDAFFFSGVNPPLRGATIDQTVPLPPGFEPLDIEYLDLNGDGRIDIRISDFGGGPDICLINSGGPPSSRFSIGPCVFVPPCCIGNADKISPGGVAFADITAVLSNFGAPADPAGDSVGDADCNGFINFSDITAVLSNFGNACP